MKTTKIFIHLLILGVFCFGCFFAWGLLEMASHVGGASPNLPQFTQFCRASLRPVAMVLSVVAALYCVWVAFRKADRVPSWVGFFATMMGLLVLVTMPALLAAYLPVVSVLDRLPAK